MANLKINDRATSGQKMSTVTLVKFRNKPTQFGSNLVNYAPLTAPQPRGGAPGSIGMQRLSPCKISTLKLGEISSKSLRPITRPIWLKFGKKYAARAALMALQPRGLQSYIHAKF